MAATFISTGGATGDLYFVHSDYLGSILGLSNQSGYIAEEYSYDAWGNRRNENNWATPDNRRDFLINRGYTLHSLSRFFFGKHINGFGLINMFRPTREHEQKLRVTFGRVYDPKLGRFLSPDPILQDAGNTQNMNRYSYVWNNPLKYTDPSGYKNQAAVATDNGGEPGQGSYNANWYGTGGGGGYGGSGFGGINGPGVGGNGTGLGGVYYDWLSGTYRSTTNTNQEIGWRNAYNTARNNGPTYVIQHAYVGSGAARYYKGSSLRLSREPLIKPVKVGCSNFGKDHSFQIYAEFSFSLGPQIGASVNWIIPLISGRLKGPSLNWKIKPYFQYSKINGWSFDIDVKKNQTRKAANWAVPFNSGSAEQFYGLDAHPDLYDITSERTRGLETISTNMNYNGVITEKTYFDLKWGSSVSILLFGTGVNYGIKEN